MASVPKRLLFSLVVHSSSPRFSPSLSLSLLLSLSLPPSLPLSLSLSVSLSLSHALLLPLSHTYTLTLARSVCVRVSVRVSVLWKGVPVFGLLLGCLLRVRLVRHGCRCCSYVCSVVGRHARDGLSFAGQPNERVLYQLPTDPSRLIMLLRAGTHGNEHLLASNCKLPGGAPEPTPTNATMHFCRPGTGLFNAGLPGDRMPSAHAAARARAAAGGPWPGYHPVPVGRSCNWTAPYFTTIPDSHSRACTAPLPDGRVFMIGVRDSSARALAPFTLLPPPWTVDATCWRGWGVPVESRAPSNPPTL